MPACILDASALLRFLLNEPGALRVEQIIREQRQRDRAILISAVNWGEILYKIDRAQGRTAAQALTSNMLFVGLQIVPVDVERTMRAAFLKNDLRLGYADAFCVELAISIPDHLLVTADYDFQVATQLASIEFLPRVPVP